MFCWTSESNPLIALDRGLHGYIARIGVMRRASDASIEGDSGPASPRARDQVTVWVDSDRWSAEWNMER